jgi:hypothetical protein
MFIQIRWFSADADWPYNKVGVFHGAFHIWGPQMTRGSFAAGNICEKHTVHVRIVNELTF